MVNNETRVKVLTIAAICEKLDISRQTFYNKIRHRVDPFPNSSGRVLYRQTDIEKLQDEMENQSKNKDFEIVK